MKKFVIPLLFFSCKLLANTQDELISQKTMDHLEYECRYGNQLSCNILENAFNLKHLATKLESKGLLHSWTLRGKAIECYYKSRGLSFTEKAVTCKQGEKIARYFWLKNHLEELLKKREQETK